MIEREFRAVYTRGMFLSKAENSVLREDTGHDSAQSSAQRTSDPPCFEWKCRKITWITAPASCFAWYQNKASQPVSFRDLVNLIALPFSESLPIDYTDHEDKTQETVSEEISGIWNSLEIK